MKKNYTLVLLLATLFGFAQIPAGYYNTATGTGYTLKTQLKNIIATHTNITYTGLWNLYPFSDKRSDGKVWDIYSSCNLIFGTVASGGNQDNGTLGANPCERFNREHSFPKSWFGGSTSSDPGCDAFHVMPTDKKINGLRSNYCYGTVPTTNNTIPLSYPTTCKLGVNNTAGAPSGLIVFEPADEFKGDVARNYFYMATCYENVIASWQNIDTANGANFLDGTNTTCYKPWALNMLYQWHLADPVSQKEIDRNNVIYYNSNGQANRNPYIDNPQWVLAVWGANLATESYDYLATTYVYPNPAKDYKITIESPVKIDDIQLININGQLMIEIKKPIFENNTYSLENLPQGFYFLKMISDNKSVTKKVIIN
jgi:endonuclease I